MRADGSFRQWTIFNQGPGGSSKFGLVDDVWMAVRAGDDAKVLRTQPPGYLAGHAVDSLNFGGTYPVTRLKVSDKRLESTGLSLALYAHSTFKPFNYEKSGFPALVLTLVASNPSLNTDTPVDFMFTLPAAGWTDCSRHGDGNGGQSAATTYSGCLHDCHSLDTCQSWQFSDGKCTLNGDIPLTAHAVGSYCGVKGSGWIQGPDYTMVSQDLNSTSINPAKGDFTLATVASRNAQANATFAASDSPELLWDSFSATGALPSGNRSATVAAHGAAALSAIVPRNSSITLSVVVAWHFPNRDFSGQILGNNYANFWADSVDVATALAVEDVSLCPALAWPTASAAALCPPCV